LKAQNSNGRKDQENLKTKGNNMLGKTIAASVSGLMLATAVFMPIAPARAANISNEKKYAALIQKTDMDEDERQSAERYSDSLKKESKSLKKEKSSTLESILNDTISRNDAESEAAFEKSRINGLRDRLKKERDSLTKHQKKKDSTGEILAAVEKSLEKSSAGLEHLNGSGQKPEGKTIVEKAAYDDARTKSLSDAIRKDELSLEESEKNADEKVQQVKNTDEGIQKKVGRISDIDKRLKKIKETRKTIRKNIAASIENEEYSSDNADSSDSRLYRTHTISDARVQGKGKGCEIARKALTRQGSPYVWGACHSLSEMRNPSQRAFDCSGLVNWTLAQTGVSRGSNTSGGYASVGRPVSPSELKPGDILTFSSNGKASGVHHVGIYIGNGRMVHAPHSGSSVRIQSISNGYYARQLFAARRVA
jgi:cell wall-associated NlpC family hydrolase